MNRPARPQVKATVGGKPPSQVGMDALLDFQMEVTLDGETLSAAEIKRLLAQSEGLAFIRGKWVEVDHERLAPDTRTIRGDRTPRRRSKACRSARRCACWPAPASPMTALPARADIDWSETVAGPWLAETLAGLAPPRWARACRSRPIASRHVCVPISRRACNGSICSRSSGLVPASPTTWGSARPSRCLSLLLVLKSEAGRYAQAVSAGGTGLAACQLGRGNRAILRRASRRSWPIRRRCRRSN